jgi:hypothetical protein
MSTAVLAPGTTHRQEYLELIERLPLPGIFGIPSVAAATEVFTGRIDQFFLHINDVVRPRRRTVPTDACVFKIVKEGGTDVILQALGSTPSDHYLTEGQVIKFCELYGSQYPALAFLTVRGIFMVEERDGVHDITRKRLGDYIFWTPQKRRYIVGRI